VLADVTGECSATVTAPTTTDACAGTILGTTADDLTYTTEGTHVVTWNFDDGNGNSIDVTQNVIIADITAPTATCPENVVTCDGSAGFIGLTDLIDNCTVPTVTYELTGATTASGSGDASGNSFNVGETTITYTLTDGSGNSSQCIFTVTHEEVDEILVTSSENTLTVQTGGSYQWINCADNSIIPGQTEAFFSPAENGDYAVIVTQGTCSATSECYSVELTGLRPNGADQGIRVYPVPAHETLTIEMSQTHTNATIKVVNATGQTVLVKRMEELIKTNLDLSQYDSGMYLILIESDQQNSYLRIVKE